MMGLRKGTINLITARSNVGKTVFEPLSDEDIKEMYDRHIIQQGSKFFKSYKDKLNANET